MGFEYNMNDQEKFTVGSSIDIKTCLKKLDKAACGVTFVIDNDGRLIGSVSDGDIRRALLAGKTLDESIDGLYNTSPVSIGTDESEESIRSSFLDKRLGVLPITDGNGLFVSVLEWETFFGEEYQPERQKLDLPVIIMAGGKGTRMAPFTNVLPKPLVPIREKTIMEIIIEQFRSYSIKDFFFILNYKGKMIEAYFDSIERDYKVHYVWEKEFEGTAGSLKLLPEDFPENFILSNCDVIVKADYGSVLKKHIENQALVTVLSSYQHYQIPYGIVEYAEDGRIIALREKPEYSFPVNTGVYVINRKALKFIPHEGIFHMTHLIEALMRDNQVVSAYPLGEYNYIDVGQWEEYRKAVRIL